VILEELHADAILFLLLLEPFDVMAPTAVPSEPAFAVVNEISADPLLRHFPPRDVRLGLFRRLRASVIDGNILL